MSLFVASVGASWAPLGRLPLRKPSRIPCFNRPDGGASEDMLHALRKYRNWLPRNKRKVAQQMPKTGICQGFTLGLTTDYKVGGQGTPVISKATRAHPGLAEALCRGCRSANPEFHFTSIQVNLNTKYGMHTDGFDAGPSRMIALGNFSKGHLWLHDCRRNHWSLVDVRNTWIAFDGREFHLTEDWEGPERYSLVFFTNHLWDELLPEVQRATACYGCEGIWGCSRLKKRTVDR
ncbi:Hypothetical protein SCF082_LOCUS34034 [Durusdinium trenchii]|uniref:Uncharacterized protein n=1 Tax=Durusdinium trenchii TaxID=1381693 RepID=A0ABP0NWM8_9DINO